MKVVVGFTPVKALMHKEILETGWQLGRLAVQLGAGAATVMARARTRTAVLVLVRSHFLLAVCQWAGTLLEGWAMGKQGPQESQVTVVALGRLKGC
jgi:hypothetical protein